jgi:hypothetical protein
MTSNSPSRWRLVGIAGLVTTSRQRQALALGWKKIKEFIESAGEGCAPIAKGRFFVWPMRGAGTGTRAFRSRGRGRNATYARPACQLVLSRCAGNALSPVNRTRKTLEKGESSPSDI